LFEGSDPLGDRVEAGRVDDLDVLGGWGGRGVPRLVDDLGVPHLADGLALAVRPRTAASRNALGDPRLRDLGVPDGLGVPRVSGANLR